jgi:hypothetical protein
MGMQAKNKILPQMNTDLHGLTERGRRERRWLALEIVATQEHAMDENSLAKTRAVAH